MPNQESNLPEFGQNKPEKYIRPVMVNTRTAEVLDSKIINYELYNSFNYSLFLSEGQNAIRCSLGITSPNSAKARRLLLVTLLPQSQWVQTGRLFLLI